MNARAMLRRIDAALGEISSLDDKLQGVEQGVVLMRETIRSLAGEVREMRDALASEVDSAAVATPPARFAKNPRTKLVSSRLGQVSMVSAGPGVWSIPGGPQVRRLKAERRGSRVVQPWVTPCGNKFDTAKEACEATVDEHVVAKMIVAAFSAFH